MENTKKCSKCGRELPLECFGKHKKAKDGLQWYCKECKKQYNSEHTDEIKIYNKQYYTDNSDSIKQRTKQYRVENIERIKQYLIDNAVHIKQRSKQYRDRNKEKIAMNRTQWYSTEYGYAYMNYHSYLQNDKKYKRVSEKLPSNYVTIEQCIELFHQRDHYDGKQYDFFEMGLDRIDNSKPHTLDNVVPCTTSHNKQRGLMTYEEYKNKLGVSPTS